MTDQLLDTDPTAMIRQAPSQDAMAEWGDLRRKEFCDTFAARTRAARFILAKTARIVLEKAIKSHIAGAHALDEIQNSNVIISSDVVDQYGHGNGQVGGRSTNDLTAIAEERADKILADLPGVRKAMSILQPDVVKMIDARDALKKKGQTFLDRLNEISQPIALSDVDQNMTIGAFRTFAKEREKARRDLVAKLNEVGEEGTSLDEQINKKLYKGVPGLHEAVVQVAKTHLEKSKAFEEIGRRVQEKVMFGDSKAAQDLLHHFETDEVSISEAVRAELKMAVQKLLGSAPKKGKK